MLIRLPVKTVLDVNNSTINATGPASVSGGVAHSFQLPQDCDNVVVKLSASVMAGGVSATFQTSDDGGTTWYDVARTSIVSNAGATTGTAEWMSIPVVSSGVNPQVISTVNAGSVVGGTIGSSAASSLGNRQISGLPILGINNRIFLRYTSAVTSIISERVTVSANSQTPGN